MSFEIPQFNAISEKLLLIAQGDNVYFLDESGVTLNTAQWVSPSLNRGDDPSALYTIRQLFVEYQANGANGSIDIEFSGDGGENWSTPVSITVVDTGGRVTTASVGGNVTGRDLRVRITIDSTIPLRVIAITPRIIQRGNP